MKTIFPLIFLIAVVLGCGNADKSTTPTTTQTANSNTANPVKQIQIKAVELAKAYKENELAADDKFKGKPLEVSGKVTEISETLGTYQVELEGVSQSGLNILGVRCVFPESEKQNLSKLKKGQTAKFQGIGDGLTLNLYAGLSDCKVIL